MSESQFFVLMSVAFTAPNLPTWTAIAMGGICCYLASRAARREK
ncbi:hypothetical protein [Delftia acidovorans]